MSMKRRALVVLVAFSALGVLAACDDPSASQQATVSPPAPVRSPADLNAREAASAAPDFDTGHTVHITPAGIQPKQLVTFCCDPVVFKNETSAPVSVMFDISRAASGSIAPGGTWSWTPPHAESVLYHLVTGSRLAGQIQIESPNW
jgi:hypothetical protein